MNKIHAIQHFLHTTFSQNQNVVENKVNEEVDVAEDKAYLTGATHIKIKLPIYVKRVNCDKPWNTIDKYQERKRDEFSDSKHKKESTATLSNWEYQPDKDCGLS